MATIDNHEIPEFILIELKQIVDSIQPAALLSFVKTRPELIKGFRPTKSNISIIRKRLKALVSESNEIDAGIASFLAEESFSMEFVSVFSEIALRYLFLEFIQYFGVPFLTATLLDRRDGVRGLAFDFLGSGEDVSPGAEGILDAEAIRSELAPFFGHIGPMLEGKQKNRNSSGYDSKDNDYVELKKCKKTIITLEKRLAKNKDDSRKDIKIGKKLGGKIDTKDREIHELRKKLEREKKTRKGLEGKTRDQADNIIKLQENFEARVKQEKEREMTGLVRSWLNKTNKTEAAVRQIQKLDNDDILARVDDILFRQDNVDRDCGNKRILLERLKKLEKARVSVTRSGAEALSPLPELLQIKKEIDRDIETIRNLLGVQGESNTLLDNVKIQINLAPNSRQLSKIQDP